MKIHFYLRYATQFGQTLFVSLNDDATLVPMEYLNDEFWHAIVDLDKKVPKTLSYRYHFRDAGGEEKIEWGNDRDLDLQSLNAEDIQVLDYWNLAGAVENVFFTQPFQEIYFKHNDSKPAKTKSAFTHVFKVKAPLLQSDEAVCLVGHGIGLRNWDSAAPLVLEREGNWWTIRLDLSNEDFPLGYKYGVWNTRTNKFVQFESGTNRTIFGLPHGSGKVVLHDGFIRLPNAGWRGAGVAIPVFSLRTKASFGVGEFSDLPALADWAKSVGLKLLQLLPVNDTSAKWAGVRDGDASEGGGEPRPYWTDSYPYAAISAFALHPIYLNVSLVADKKHAALLKPYASIQKTLNALDAVDYEAVLRAKWEIVHLLYPVLKSGWAKDSAYLSYFEENKHWLVPYGAFCYLRDKNGTTDFNQWNSNQAYDKKEIEQLVSPKAPHYDEVAIHYFVQWHLHLQLKAAADYAHANGLALKGDIPIGIYRYSCDAWVAPELYNMDQQAGAPPDDFAEKGQNWGFPTYNWDRMKQDGFAWWRQRFSQMKLYFDAFRIDHILGFFRIWSIPLGAVEGIMGHFVPAIPVTEDEFKAAGIGFNKDRLCKPYITDQVLLENFGDAAEYVKEHYLDPIPGAGVWTGSSQYTLRPTPGPSPKEEGGLTELRSGDSAGPGENSDGLSQTSGKKKSAAKRDKTNTPSKNLKANEIPKEDSGHAPLPLGGGVGGGVLNLISNVILFEDPAGGYHFRFGIEKTSSYRNLPEEVKGPIMALYVNYFYRRQDEFWKKEAMEKLPALKRSTNMLICGEDLGMVPASVPDVMQELGILSLEIQRMPKAAGATFFHPKEAPYLSVVTPSTHDMSTIRGWWEEDRKLSQRFFNEELGFEGNAPYFCEPWLNHAILVQHFQSPAMWAIFQMQDLMGLDGTLRRANPEDERINVPANPTHYWRYRMHVPLDDLMQADGFNSAVRSMVQDSGR